MKTMNEVEEYYYYSSMNNLTFYHGTSSAIGITDTLLPPTETNTIREDFRDKRKNLVFLTTSKLSAFRYAIKACAKFGGKPVVYEVKPDSLSIEQRIDNEYVCTHAKIIKEVKI